MPEVALGNLRLNIAEDGPREGRVLILSNSLASNVSMWSPQIDALAAEGWRVIRYDNRGHGRSAVVDAPYSVEDMADDVAALMDALDIATAHFCGLSLGGMVGQMFAVRHASRVESLTLCDTAAHMGPPGMWDERIEAVSGAGMAAVVEATLGRWFTEAGRARLPAAVAAVREGILGTSTAGFCRACAAIRDMDQRDSIRAISVPTHVMVGEADPSTPVEAAALIHERIPGSRLTVIADAAHMANIEQAGSFNDALLDFLRSHA